jgi:uncharacterized RDD family membrane protein YckC
MTPISPSVAPSGFAPPHGEPTATPHIDLQAPALLRRMACFAYEGVLLFGVVMAAGFAYGVVTQQRHALVGATGLKAFLFVVLAVYFVGFWSRTGQTLAMLTWQLRLVDLHGKSVGKVRALARYVLSWLWFLPALLAVNLSGLKGTAFTFTALAAGILTYAALSQLHPQRQFFHDAVCGTRLVNWQTAKQKKQGGSV